MRLGLTGTPIENNITELKALLDIVLPGFMPSPALFREQFVNPIERYNDEEKQLLFRVLCALLSCVGVKLRFFRNYQKNPKIRSIAISLQTRKALCRSVDRHREEVIQALRQRDESIPYLHIFSLLSL